MKNYLFLLIVILFLKSCASTYTLDEINKTLKSAKSQEVEMDNSENNSKKIFYFVTIYFLGTYEFSSIQIIFNFKFPTK